MYELIGGVPVQSESWPYNFAVIVGDTYWLRSWNISGETPLATLYLNGTDTPDVPPPDPDTPSYVPTSYIDITALPFETDVDVTELANLNEIWFRYVAPAGQVAVGG